MGGPRHSGRTGTGRRVQQRDIAEIAGVSVSTVSRVLKNVEGISQEVRKRVLEAATNLGYQRGNLEQIHLFVHSQVMDRPGHFNADVMAGVEAECRQHGIRLSYAVSEPDQEGQQRILEMLHQQSDDGFILVTQGDRKLVEQALQITPRLVLISTEHRGLPVDMVMPDNYTGGLQGTRYLLERGHRSIVNLSYMNGITRYRTSGYRDALQEAGIPYDPRMVLETRLDQGSAYECMKEFLASKPPRFTAVFCANDYTASGAMLALLEAGLRVPQDVSVVGFDDMITSAFLVPPLTTVRVEREEMGKFAVRRLLARADDPLLPTARVEIHTHLVERQSVISVESE